MTRAVLFDFYGTVAHATTWGPSREEVLGRHGFSIPDDARRRWLTDTLDGIEHIEHSRSRDHYRSWERRRLLELVTACGVGPDDAGQLVDELDESSQAFTMAAYPEAPEVLSALRDRDIVVALCSNWTWDLDRAVEQAGLSELFDVVVASAHAGARKPHPRIFRQTLEACRVGAGAALFVGDSFGPDVEGPLAVGIGPVHVWRSDTGHQAGQPPPLPAGARRVEDLREVLELVGGG